MKFFETTLATIFPFSHFCPDPEPHAFFGMSIADLTMDIQRIKSAVLRASLDSLAMSTHPRVGVVEGQASLEDVMNVEAGGIIRMRSSWRCDPIQLAIRWARRLSDDGLSR